MNFNQHSSQSHSQQHFPHAAVDELQSTSYPINKPRTFHSSSGRCASINIISTQFRGKFSLMQRLMNFNQLSSQSISQEIFAHPSLDELQSTSYPIKCTGTFHSSSGRCASINIISNQIAKNISLIPQLMKFNQHGRRIEQLFRQRMRENFHSCGRR